MSATLDNDRLQRMLPQAPVVTSAGRAFPVEKRYQALARTSALMRRWR
ncbi:ATP-dependent RNA helicase HrpB [Raoultella terrigena]|uniref:ATP-dependent RNA helicase HrpB n=1 Tax=Raoultella terrigena TaxID=577 RepID=A0A4V6J2I6_RAOTE|nr:ATP-dependent RNA helicase HrpB [Raoultella terrigena]